MTASYQLGLSNDVICATVSQNEDGSRNHTDLVQSDLPAPPWRQLHLAHIVQAFQMPENYYCIICNPRLAFVSPIT